MDYERIPTTKFSRVALPIAMQHARWFEACGLPMAWDSGMSLLVLGTEEEMKAMHRHIGERVVDSATHSSFFREGECKGCK